jgi:hypothetical protein
MERLLSGAAVLLAALAACTSSPSASSPDQVPFHLVLVSTDWRQAVTQPVTTLGPSSNAHAHAVLRNTGGNKGLDWWNDDGSVDIAVNFYERNLRVNPPVCSSDVRIKPTQQVEVDCLAFAVADPKTPPFVTVSINGDVPIIPENAPGG